MKITPTRESLQILERISNDVFTWHHHHFIMYDIAQQMYPSDYKLNYAEIGCYAGASACMMLQRPDTKVVSIDLGMIPTEEVLGNVARHNVYNNEFHYITGNSQDPATISTFLSKMDKIDILFIDGSHEYDDAIRDFLCYKDFVNSKGFIVFDDYHDPQYQVKSAVDYLAMRFSETFRFIGTVENVLNAKGDIPEGNCFIVEKE